VTDVDDLQTTAKAGAVVRQADPHTVFKPQSECARGPERKRRALRSRPSGLRDRARHQPRSASRGVAGCPRSVDSAAAPAQGKAFPYR
jgi:hypothetical protein